MDGFIRENFGRIAAWIPLVLLVLLVGAGLLGWRLSRSTRKIWVKLVGIVTSLSIIGFVIVALYVAYGPMAPLFTNAQRLQLSIGDPAPDVAFQMVTDGSEARLSGFRGKVLLVNLWATWCPPCVAELPTLNRLQAIYRNRGLIVITLSDEAMTSIRPFVNQRSPETVNGYVESFDWLPIRDFRPFTLIIDRDGILRDYMFADQAFETFEKRIRSYL
jgi:thiol-disulfide isomerase/thioredoxin